MKEKINKFFRNIIILTVLGLVGFLFVKSPYFSMVEKDGNYLISTFGYTISIIKE